MLNRLRLSLVMGLVALFVGCGGGNSSAPVPTIGGVVAVGAAVAGATVTVYDSRGDVVGSGTADSNGVFSIKLDKVGTAPYVIRATKDEIALTALVPAVSGSESVVNITPVSEAVAALASPTGSTADLVAALKDSNVSTSLTPAKIQEVQAVVAAAIQPVLSALNLSITDVLSKSFSTNGQGADKALDALAVTVSTQTSDSGTKTANVQVVFKAATDSTTADQSTQAVNLTSTSSKEQAAAASLNISLSKDDLPPDNAAGLYKDFIDSLNACYALPKDQRSDGTEITSPVCKRLFVEQDPKKYLNGGQVVRNAAGAAFRGIFTAAEAVTFKPVRNQYFVQDLKGSKTADGKGKAIIGLSWVNESGNRENISLYVTKYIDSDGKERLGASGDQNRYGFFANSHNQKREFPLRSDASLDYVQAGYLVALDDVREAGQTVLKFVRVQSPAGKTLVFTPGTGAQRFLRLCIKGEVKKDTDGTSLIPSKEFCTGNYFITTSERFTNAQEKRRPSEIYNAGIVRPLDDNLEPFTPDDETVKQWPSIGLWKAEYFFKDARPNLMQRTWSLARPMTTGELISANGPDARMPKLTESAVKAFKDLKSSRAGILGPCFSGSTTCVSELEPVPAPETGGFAFSWTGGTTPTTKIWISGRVNDPTKNFISSFIGPSSNGVLGQAWDDEINIPSSKTSATVTCSKASESDIHCSATGSVGDYSPQTWMSYSELWGKDEDQRTLMRSYNWFRPTKNVAGESF